MIRKLWSAVRAAPVLAVATSVAVVIAIACVISAVAAFAAPSSVTAEELRDLRVYRDDERVRAGAERWRQACETALDQRRPTVVAQGVEAPNLYEQNAATVAEPTARRIVPARPEGVEFSAYRFRHYFAFVSVASVDLANRTASLQLVMRAGANPKGPRPEAFPSGTRLHLGIVGLSGNDESEIPSTLPEGTTARFSVVVPLSGLTEAYPDDTYSVALGPVYVRASIPGKRDSFYAIDFNEAGRDPALSSELRVIQVPGVKLRFDETDFCQTRFGFIIERSGGELFVWLMAAIPLVLLLVVLHSLRTVRSRAADPSPERRQGPFESSAALQAGVAVLAILPLRAVLVPSEITTVTRVDYLLAAELALFVFALCAGALIAHVAGRSPSEPRRPARGPAS